MSTTSQEIQRVIESISGKRRLTLLNKYVQSHYKAPKKILSSITDGDYSPNDVVTHLRLVISHLKSLCANNGRLLTRYYSKTRAEEIQKTLQPLAKQCANLSASSSETAVRTAFLAVPRTLEMLKAILGPFTDIKLASEFENIIEQLTAFQETIDDLHTTSAEVVSMAQAVKKTHAQSSSQAQLTSDIMKNTKTLEIQLVAQKDATKELYERSRVISRSVEKQQEELEKRYEHMQQAHEEIQNVKEKCNETYTDLCTKAQEFDHAAKALDEADLRIRTLATQAQQVLNISHGTGLLHTYRGLYHEARKKHLLLPWIFGAMFSFGSTVALVAFGYLDWRISQSFRVFLSNPYIVLQMLLVPFLLFIFFFCLGGWRKQKLLIEKYKVRSVAVESYLKLSDQLPIQSPERTRSAATIMKHIEQDFGPLSHSLFQHEATAYQEAI